MKIYEFSEHNLVVRGEKDDLIHLAELCKDAEGTLGDLRYQIEYAFDIDGVRSDIGYEEGYDDPDYADRYLKMNTDFVFRGQEMYYDYEWSDPDTFSFFFGEGLFVDNNGDDYFINVEYLVDADKFIFEAMFEHDCCSVTEEHLTESEKEEIKKFIKSIV